MTTIQKSVGIVLVLFASMVPGKVAFADLSKKAAAVAIKLGRAEASTLVSQGSPLWVRAMREMEELEMRLDSRIALYDAMGAIAPANDGIFRHSDSYLAFARSHLRNLKEPLRNGVLSVATVKKLSAETVELIKNLKMAPYATGIVGAAAVADQVSKAQDRTSESTFDLFGAAPRSSAGAAKF